MTQLRPKLGKLLLFKVQMAFILITFTLFKGECKILSICQLIKIDEQKEIMFWISKGYSDAE